MVLSGKGLEAPGGAEGRCGLCQHGWRFCRLAGHPGRAPAQNRPGAVTARKGALNQGFSVVSGGFERRLCANSGGGNMQIGLQVPAISC